MNSKWNLKPSCSVRAAHRMFSTSPGEAAQGDDSYSHLSLAGVAKSAGRLMARLLVLLVGMAVAAPTPSYAAQIGVGVTIRIGPPPLPVYAQPLCPGPGYIWTPGYWAYDPVDGYYWVPGTWVVAPAPGVLWTPGYWGWDAGVFLWHAGYWGPHVGFYGGVNYGFGYAGVGYEGGYWRGRNFFYNRTVNNVNVVNVTNVYNRTVVNNVSTTRVSYNGGPGGLGARPAPGENGGRARPAHPGHQPAATAPTGRAPEPCAVCLRKPRQAERCGYGATGPVPGSQCGTRWWSAACSVEQRESRCAEQFESREA